MIDNLEEVYPLSYGQQALWFLHQWAPESAAYNCVEAIRIRSKVNIAALRKAFQLLLDRHPCLRTTFLSDNSGLWQKVHKDSMVCFEHIDVSNDSQDEIDQLIRDTYRKPFDLINGPVCRINLFTQTPTDHVLLITIHHIVADFPSYMILIEELIALYSIAREGQGADLPPVALNYADFVRWQNDFPASAEGKTQWNYWLRQLSGSLPVLNLPTDHPHPLRQSFQGLTVSFRILAVLTERIRNLARAEGTTLFRVLMAAYQLMLYRYCNQDEILVSTSTSGRLKGKFDGIAGFFVNTIVLREFVKGELTFKEFLTQVDQTVRDALAHQDYPFPHLIELLQPSRDPGRDPIVQTDFTFLKPTGEHLINLYAGLPVVTEGLVLENYPLASQEGQTDLALNIIEAKNTLSCSFKGKANLFEADTLKRMGGHFRVLLEAITANPSQKISDLPILTGEEEHRVLTELNDTRVQYPSHLCLHYLFEASAERHPKAVAVESASLRLTYAQLNQKANQLAHHLQSLGVKPETTIGIYVDRSLEMIIGYLGVLKAGGAFVPLDPAYPPKRLKFLLADVGISILLTAAKYRANLSFFDSPVICLDTDSPGWSEKSTDNPLSGVRPENLAYLIYTSGSSGRPKGVMIEHSSIVNHNYSLINQFELTDKDRVLQFSKINFDVALEEIFSTFAAGGTVVLPQPENLASVSEFQRFIRAQELTLLNIPSSYWQVWVAEVCQKGMALPESLRLVIIGSEKVNLTSFNKWQQIAPDSVQLINAYGLTETTITSTVWKSGTFPDTKTLHSVPIGRPLANIQVYILNAYQQLCPVGVPGELHLGGACLTRGYKNRPESDGRNFIKNPWSADPKARLFKTGDFARYLSDGNIEYLSRLDSQVKIRGYRIELDEIEAVLGAHPTVAGNAVIVHNSHGGDIRLIAYLVLHHGQFIDKKELQTFLGERLPDYMIPAAFIPLDSLPLDPNGKIDRQTLANLSIDRELFSIDAFVAPRSAEESRLVEIWREMFGLEKISVFDNFFDLGGHSLLAAQLTLRICQAFNIELPLHFIFQSPTVAGIAQAIVRARRTGVQGLTTKTAIEIDQSHQSILDEILHDLPPVSSKAADMLKDTQAILLTGATGFLGSFLLAELLRQSTANIYCLIRPCNNGDPFLKINQVLESYSLWQEEYRQRIIPVTGDLSRPFLGLEQSMFYKLSSKTDVIYHSGAWVNHVYPYSVLKATNVSGTLEVLRLAATINTKPVHFISTLHGISDLDIRQEPGKNHFSNGYVHSKWVAERMVEQAGERGLPVCIFRPSRVTGHQQTGVSNLNDILNLLIKGCIQLGKAPKWGPIKEYLTPVDYVVSAIVFLSRHRDNYRKAFDLIHAHDPVSWDELFFEQLKSLGYGLDQISYPDWRKAVSDQATNALSSLLSLFPDQDNFVKEEEMGVPSFDCRQSKDFHNTLAGLANSSLVCPPLGRELLSTYLTNLKTIGFLEPRQAYPR